MVIGGEDDMITPVEHTARIIELLPKAEAIRIENSGHLGIIEKHDIFNGALARCSPGYAPSLGERPRTRIRASRLPTASLAIFRLLSASGPPAPCET